MAVVNAAWRAAAQTFPYALLLIRSPLRALRNSRPSRDVPKFSIPLVLPASPLRPGASSVDIQAWLAKYLKHDPRADAILRASKLSCLELAGEGQRRPMTLNRDRLLSFYFCSAYRFHTTDGNLVSNPDVAGAGCSK